MVKVGMLVLCACFAKRSTLLLLKLVLCAGTLRSDNEICWDSRTSKNTFQRLEFVASLKTTRGLKGYVSFFKISNWFIIHWASVCMVIIHGMVINFISRN